jgi:hypothetical protein
MQKEPQQHVIGKAARPVAKVIRSYNAFRMMHVAAFADLGESAARLKFTVRTFIPVTPQRYK